MIEKINKMGEEVEITIIPQLKAPLDYELSPGDTIVCYIDFDKYGIDGAEEFYKLLSKVFSNNSIVILPKGTELGVIKNDKKSL